MKMKFLATLPTIVVTEVRPVISNLVSLQYKFSSVFGDHNGSDSFVKLFELHIFFFLLFFLLTTNIAAALFETSL